MTLATGYIWIRMSHRANARKNVSNHCVQEVKVRPVQCPCLAIAMVNALLADLKWSSMNSLIAGHALH